jgi:hypothetical protein
MKYVNHPEAGGGQEGIASNALPTWEVFVLYEDFRTGLRAKSLLDRAFVQGGIQGDCCLHLWRFDVLENAAVRRWVRSETSYVDLIILSVHGQRELPSAVTEWLNSTLAAQKEDSFALVVSLDQAQREQADQSQILSALQTLTGNVNLSLFTCFDEPSWVATASLLRHLRQGLETPFHLSQEFIPSWLDFR